MRRPCSLLRVELVNTEPEATENGRDLLNKISRGFIDGWLASRIGRRKGCTALYRCRRTIERRRRLSISLKMCLYVALRGSDGDGVRGDVQWSRRRWRASGL